MLLLFEQFYLFLVLHFSELTPVAPIISYECYLKAVHPHITFKMGKDVFYPLASDESKEAVEGCK